MNERTKKLIEKITPLREQIINHQVYKAINDIQSLQTFMQYHVYAVWDFMSILKTLQNNLTCTSVPWMPRGNADTRYLINEIVTGEESDVDINGNRMSHFEMYLEAMKQCEANTAGMEAFLQTLKATGSIDMAFEASATPQAAKQFVDFTFEIISSGKDYLQAAIFTFGREDLIPGMFISIVNDIHKTFPDSISNFKYYLERHIEVDGDHHSHMAIQMTEYLCGDNEQYWKEAEDTTIRSLQMRIALWDAVYDKLSIIATPVA